MDSERGPRNGPRRKIRILVGLSDKSKLGSYNSLRSELGNIPDSQIIESPRISIVGLRSVPGNVGYPTIDILGVFNRRIGFFKARIESWKLELNSWIPDMFSLMLPGESSAGASVR